jgi:3-oxoacyl-[acyl-carrier protein] reductase
MSQELTGRVAIVTGAARNIGRAIAVALGRAGASVAVNAKGSAELAEETANAVRDVGADALVHLADIATPAGGAALIAATVKRFGQLDILVNNAAIRRETAFADLGWPEWREVLSVILDGAYICAHAALPHLEQSAAGSIVNIGGMSAHSGSARRAHVIAAKAGLVGLTRALAHDLGPAGITVNCVVPGLIDTVRAPAQGVPAHHSTHATLLGRRGTPDDVAGIVRFLCGPDGRYMTGQTIHVNGGVFMP